ncbi:DUF4097 domain-containing protein [Schnuerera sp. xch1]|uniref:DUF4097 family beta strand repeat-containing protein n=1 Tax=Schnuerera sp. xch1 TaxID=2874283 RepID=UPI001CC0A4D2|nr:DUF4097 family beta strand repeat-containing protein [Schnuerera sp. xch1]MBZ2174020.1 DUF4097 domain-containing protein [Schnuerera sp. xch1]
MSNMKKIIMLALGLLIVGAIGSIFTFSSLNRETTVSEEKYIDENITSIEISTRNVEVEVLSTNENNVKVELTGNVLPNIDYSLSTSVEDSTLLIEPEMSEHSWFNLMPIALRLKVYLPSEQYDSLYVENDNGLVHVKDSTINNVIINTTNGMVDVQSITSTNIDVQTASGKITMKHVNGEITGKSGSGPIKVQTKSLDHPVQLETKSGGILLQTEQPPTNVTFEAETGTGRIDILDQYTGKNIVIGNGENLIKLKTGTGSITVE